MGSFEDIRLQWAGKDYTIRANRVLGAIARIEDVLTLSELQRFSMRGTAPMAKLSMAYGAVLRYAGATVTDEEVYAGMFGETGTGADAVVESISALVAMMVPPQPKTADKEPKSGNAVPAATASSKRRTRLRSASGK
jgi:hypothetical protein